MKKYKTPSNYKQIYEPLMSIPMAKPYDDMEDLDISQIFKIKKTNIMNKIPFINFRLQKLKALSLFAYLYHADDVVRKHLFLVIILPFQFQFCWDYSKNKIAALEGAKREERLKIVKRAYNAKGK